MRWDGEQDGCRPRQPARRLHLLLAWQRILLGAALMAQLERQGHEVLVSDGDAAPGDAIDLVLIKVGLALPDPRALAAGLSSAVLLVVLAFTPDCPGLIQLSATPVAGLVFVETNAPKTLLLGLATVTAGGRWFDSAAMADIHERSEAMRDAATLTRREHDLAQLAAAGQRNRAIARSLSMAEDTVKVHLHNVDAKLSLQNHTQLAMDERLRVPMRM
jgi:DNA-binding NarL/FixJ family response regulator